MFNLIQIPSLQWIPKILTHRTSAAQHARNTIREHEDLPSSEDIRDLISELLSQCHISFSRTAYDNDLHNICIHECKLNGYPIDKAYGKSSILKYIPSGVIIASTAYGHLKNRPTQVFIALYTTFITWIGDTYAQDVRGLDCFNERLIAGQKQANEGLDGFAQILREINLHYRSVQANVILTSSLNFMTSTILEFDTQGVVVSPDAKSYATFLRFMSGAPEAYSMFIFPPEVPIKMYIQAMPALCLCVNYLNDLFSLHKEDLAGDNADVVNLRGENKISVFAQLAEEMSLCISRITDTLECNIEANNAFQSFVQGYISITFP